MPEESSSEVRGLGATDRIALRIVSAVLIAGIIGLFTILMRNSTTLAVVQNDLKNLAVNIDNQIGRLTDRVTTIENKTNNGYSYKDATRDQQLINFKIEKLDQRLTEMENKSE